MVLETQLKRTWKIWENLTLSQHLVKFLSILLYIFCVCPLHLFIWYVVVDSAHLALLSQMACTLSCWDHVGNTIHATQLRYSSTLKWISELLSTTAVFLLVFTHFKRSKYALFLPLKITTLLVSFLNFSLACCSKEYLLLWKY